MDEEARFCPDLGSGADRVRIAGRQQGWQQWRLAFLVTLVHLTPAWSGCSGYPKRACTTTSARLPSRKRANDGAEVRYTYDHFGLVVEDQHFLVDGLRGKGAKIFRRSAGQDSALSSSAT